MKKAVIIAIVVLVVAGVALSYFLATTGKATKGTSHQTQAKAPAVKKHQQTNMAAYFPQETVLMVSISDVGELRKTILNSDYYKGLEQTAVWKQKVAPGFAQMNMALAGASAEMNTSFDVEFIWELLGEYVGFGVISSGEEAGPPTFAGVLKVSNNTTRKRAITVAKAIAKSKGLPEPTVSEFKNAPVYGFTAEPGGGGVFIGEVADHFVISDSMKTLKAIVRLIGGAKAGSLAESEGYASVAKDLETGGFSEIYMDIGEGMDTITSLVSGMPGGAAAQMEGMPKQAGHSIARSYIDNGIRVDSLSIIDEEGTAPEIIEYHTKLKPDKLSILSLVPKGSVMVVGSNCMDAQLMYKMSVESITTQNPMAAVLISGYLSQLDTKMGLSLVDDVLPLIGSELALYLKGLDLEQVLSLPEVGLILTSSDPDKLLKTFPKFGDALLSFAEDKAPKAEHVDKKYKGHTLHEITLPMPIGSVSLAAAAVDNYFCVGFSANQVGEMIDCLTGEKDDFTKDERYRVFTKDTPDKINQTGFFDFEDAWRQLRVALKRYGQSNPDTEQTLEFVDVLIRPLKAAYSFAVYEEDFVQKSTLKIRIETEP